MKSIDADSAIRHTRRATAAIGALGTAVYLCFDDWKAALAFLLGAFGSLGNLWLFDWLARGISPEGSTARKPWQAGAFMARQIILVGFGYAIVKALGINALA